MHLKYLVFYIRKISVLFEIFVVNVCLWSAIMIKYDWLRICNVLSVIEKAHFFNVCFVLLGTRCSMNCHGGMKQNKKETHW